MAENDSGGEKLDFKSKLVMFQNAGKLITIPPRKPLSSSGSSASVTNGDRKLDSSTPSEPEVEQKRKFSTPSINRSPSSPLFPESSKVTRTSLTKRELPVPPPKPKLYRKPTQILDASKVSRSKSSAVPKVPSQEESSTAEVQRRKSSVSAKNLRFRDTIDFEDLHFERLSNKLQTPEPVQESIPETESEASSDEFENCSVGSEEHRLEESDQQNYNIHHSNNNYNYQNGHDDDEFDDDEEDDEEDNHQKYYFRNGTHLTPKPKHPQIAITKITKTGSFNGIQTLPPPSSCASTSKTLSRDHPKRTVKVKKPIEEEVEEKIETKEPRYLRIDILLTEAIENTIDQSKLYYQYNSINWSQYRDHVKPLLQLIDSSNVSGTVPKQLISPTVPKQLAIASKVPNFPRKVERVEPKPETEDRNSADFHNRLNNILNSPPIYLTSPKKLQNGSHYDSEEWDPDSEEDNQEEHDYEEINEEAPEVFETAKSTEPELESVIFKKFESIDYLHPDENSLKQTFREHKIMKRFNQEFYTEVSKFHLALRSFFLDFRSEYNKDFEVRNELRIEDSDKHMENKRNAHKNALDQLVDIYAYLLGSVINIQNTKQYADDLINFLYDFSISYSEAFVDYLTKYSDNVDRIECKKYSDLMVKNLGDIQYLCKKLEKQCQAASGVFKQIGYIFEESKTSQKETDILRHLMAIKLVFSPANPPMRLEISKNNNRVIAEMQVFLKEVNRPSSHLSHSLSAMYAQPLRQEPKRVNVFLLEDRLILANYSKTQDKQSLHFYAYMPDVEVKPICKDQSLNKNKIRLPLNILNDDTIRETASETQLTFHFKEVNDHKERTYEATIERIEHTSLKGLREEPFVMRTLVNNAIRFWELFSRTKEEYTQEKALQESDPNARFVRDNSIWSLQSKSKLI